MIGGNEGDGVEIFRPTSISNPFAATRSSAMASWALTWGAAARQCSTIRSATSGPTTSRISPCLSAAYASGGSTTIDGTLSAPQHDVPGRSLLEPIRRSLGLRPGQTYLGDVAVTTDVLGNASFSTTVAASVPVGQVITATATDPAGNTSEFRPIFRWLRSRRPPCSPPITPTVRFMARTLP